MTTVNDLDQIDLSVATAAPNWPARQMWAAKARAVDFYELTKPRMNFLVVITTMVGFYMAVRGRSDWARLPATLIGTALTAAGASVLNQFFERRLDSLMPRTRNRPLPAGRINPAEALGYGVGLAFGGIALLALLVNGLTAILGAVTLLTYLGLYTPMKRVTSLNTVIGAIPGAIPPVMGFTAVRGSLDVQALSLFLILFIWQMPHFLAIAILYRDDYQAAGFKMLPVVDGPLRVTGRQIVVYAAALIPVSTLPALLNMSGSVYFIGAVVLGLSFLYFAIACARTGNRRDARKLFFASIIYLPVLLCLLMINGR